MSQEVSTTTFSYEVVASETASKLKMLANEIQFIDRMACFEIGGRLKVARDELKSHGSVGSGFKEWVSSETNYSRQAAYDLIHIHENLTGLFVHSGVQMNNNDSHLSSFNYASLRLMASPSYPEEGREKLLEESRAGQVITAQKVKDVRQELEQARKEADEARKAQAEAAAQAEELRAQQIDAANRLERAKEAYREQREELERMKAKPPITIEVEKEVVPRQYVDLDQALQSRRNLMEDAESAMKSAKSEEQRAKQDLERIRFDISAAKHDREKEQSERTHMQGQQVALTSLRTSIAGFLKNNADNFMVLDGSYMQAADQDYLLRVESHLREMADKLAEVRDVSANYAEYEVVNG